MQSDTRVLSAEERIHTYSLALTRYEENGCGTIIGVCKCIYYAHRTLYGDELGSGYDKIPYYYPEIKRPTKGDSYYWWPIEDRKSRIDFLNKAIKTCIQLVNTVS
jgi:hypothetical protein